MSRSRRGLAAWLAYAGSHDADALDALLADDVVFHSPIVDTPQAGRARTRAYLLAADRVLGSAASFRYVREFVDDDRAVLEFEAEIVGTLINGVDMIVWNEAGKIGDFKAMVRPLKAIELLHRLMRAELEKPASN